MADEEFRETNRFDPPSRFEVIVGKVTDFLLLCVLAGVVSFLLAFFGVAIYRWVTWTFDLGTKAANAIP